MKPNPLRFTEVIGPWINHRRSAPPPLETVDSSSLAEMAQQSAAFSPISLLQMSESDTEKTPLTAGPNKKRKAQSSETAVGGTMAAGLGAAAVSTTNATTTASPAKKPRTTVRAALLGGGAVMSPGAAFLQVNELAKSLPSPTTLAMAQNASPGTMLLQASPASPSVLGAHLRTSVTPSDSESPLNTPSSNDARRRQIYAAAPASAATATAAAATSANAGPSRITSTPQPRRHPSPQAPPPFDDVDLFPIENVDSQSHDHKNQFPDEYDLQQKTDAECVVSPIRASSPLPFSLAQEMPGLQNPQAQPQSQPEQEARSEEEADDAEEPDEKQKQTRARGKGKGKALEVDADAKIQDAPDTLLRENVMQQYLRIAMELRKAELAVVALKKQRDAVMQRAAELMRATTPMVNTLRLPTALFNTRANLRLQTCTAERTVMSTKVMRNIASEQLRLHAHLSDQEANSIIEGAEVRWRESKLAEKKLAGSSSDSHQPRLKLMLLFEEQELKLPAKPKPAGAAGAPNRGGAGRGRGGGRGRDQGDAQAHPEPVAPEPMEQNRERGRRRGRGHRGGRGRGQARFVDVPIEIPRMGGGHQNRSEGISEAPDGDNAFWEMLQ